MVDDVFGQSPDCPDSHLGVHGVRVGGELGLDPARLHPPPVDGVEPGVDLDLHHAVPAAAAAQSVGGGLLQQPLAQRPARVREHCEQSARQVGT